MTNKLFIKLLICILVLSLSSHSLKADYRLPGMSEVALVCRTVLQHSLTGLEKTSNQRRALYGYQEVSSTYLMCVVPIYSAMLSWDRDRSTLRVLFAAHFVKSF